MRTSRIDDRPQTPFPEQEPDYEELQEGQKRRKDTGLKGLSPRNVAIMFPLFPTEKQAGRNIITTETPGARLSQKFS